MYVKTCDDSEFPNNGHASFIAYGDKSKSDAILLSLNDAFQPGRTDEFDV